MKLRPPNGDRPVRSRELIRTAAIQLFAEKGFAAATTREICQRAGVTKPVLYYYFNSKDRLYQEVVLDACNEARKQLVLAARGGKTTRQKLIDVLTADFAQTMRDPGLSHMFFRLLFTPRKESDGLEYVEMGEEWVRLIAGLVAEGVKRCEVRGRPREIAEALLGIHTIYTMSYLLAGKPPLDRVLARRIVDLLWAGCGASSTGQ